MNVKITFNPLGTTEAEKQYTEKRDIAKATKGSSAYKATFSAGNNSFWEQSTVSAKEKGKSLIELQQEAGNVNVAVQQDYMTVMSHTMSEEDYAKLSEEGFHFESMDPEEAVTIVDKIKAELARSGQHIAGYTDDLDVETLAAAVGSDALARSISDSFVQADIPLTIENVENVARAWEMASQLDTPGEGASRYMIDNGLEPEIWNLYLAQSSGAESMVNGAPRYYAENIQGYFTRSAEANTDTGLQAQMDKVIAEAGLEVNAESRELAAWLIQKGLPLTAESLQRLEELQGLTFPVSEEAFAQAAAIAVAEGKDPIYADLSCDASLYKKAARLAENYYSDKITVLDEGNITARRQLEEIRLRMTAEVNVKLLKSGFAIDTAPMEQLLEALKQAEEQLANQYFPGDAQAVGKYEMYQQTTQVVAEIPQLPAQLLGSWSMQEVQGSVAQFHAEGKALQQAYEKAQESYESLMTAPRGDLGDNIRKAFANVDDILTDMGYELTEENQRAIRILGYNRMNMTAENLEAVKATDVRVRFVIEKMTPAATLKMIRDGINPLEQSFAELENYFKELPEEYEQNAESYSRFLYHLEQNKEITEREREAYVGVYRLIRQIEKSDGAVIGAVVNTQAELQFRNLLAAVRTNRFKHMDVKATDETGLTAELIRSGNSISEQINNNIIATDKEFIRMQLEQIRQAVNVDADAAALLQRGELPANAENLLAAQALVTDGEAPFKKWLEKKERLSRQNKEMVSAISEDKSDAEDGLATNTDNDTDIWEKLSDKETFQASYTELLSDIMNQVEEATLNQAQSCLDVREMQMIHKQLSVATALADSEEYILPMYVGDELAKVHVTFEQGGVQKGEVSIRVDISQELHVEAHFQLRGKVLSGFLVGNTGEEVTKLTNAADIFLESVKSSGADWQVESLPVVSNYNAVNSVASTVKGADSAANKEEVQRTANTELYQIAKLFLQAIKK